MKEETNCQVCGRTAEDFERELNKEGMNFSQHQGIIKCEKCIMEYEAELSSGEKVSKDSQQETKNWKDAVTA